MDQKLNSGVLRILDASANRVREALRVLEDYARFVLNSDTLSGELKEIRHDFTSATKPFNTDAILWRDTPGDVGTEIKTAAELSRADATNVVTAAGKRLGEALRSLEEYSKIEHPAVAVALEKLRYRFYDLEHRLSFALCGVKRFENVRLCVLITESLCRRPWLQVAEEAIIGGADCLQLREKEMDGAELLCRAKSIIQLTRRHKVLSIINDRPDIALLSGADGVHVGQSDLPAREARKILGRGKIVGVSTHNMDQARQAVADGADYIGVGPVYRSSTKSREFVAGLDYARQAVKEIPIPALAIAGITETNVHDVIATGLKGIAVTAAVISCDDPRAAAMRLKEKLPKRAV